MRIKTIALIVVITLTSAVGVDAGSWLRLRVTPLASTAPTDLFIYVGVSRRPENRLLRVTAQSDEFLRSSEVQLDGELAAPVSVFMFRQLPVGEYNVDAELMDARGKTIEREHSHVLVW